MVIPARWGSTRLPGKPLAKIAGRSLLERTIDLARRATRGLDDLETVVATDDTRIADLAAALGCDVAMTAPELDSGSARALAAARQHNTRPDTIMNLQGDAPFIPATAVRAVLERLQTGVDVTTPVIQLDWDALDRMRDHKRRAPFSGTTCIRSSDGRAIWFSKQIIPAIRNEEALRAAQPLSPVFRHLGLYGFAMTALERFEHGAPAHYERLEGLEQLRLIDLDIAIDTVVIDNPPFDAGGIDAPEDIAMVERLLAVHGDPYGT